MKAIVVDEPGDECVLRIGEVDPPAMAPESVRIRVRTTALNRADLMQRRGMYPPPPGASEILGLECAGEVIEADPGARKWKPGDRVMALLPGGGYAEEVVVHEGSVLRVPEGLSDEEAGAFPEVFLTAFLNVFELGQPPEGGTVLVHGGGSGVGTAAITLAREAGLRIFVTAGSEEKCRACREHGADVAIDYRRQSFPDVVQEETGGRGVDVVLDPIGASYLGQNVGCLAVGGRLVIIGLMGGTTAEINLASLLLKRTQVIGSTLRARRVEEKARIVEAFERRFGDALRAGRIRPVIDEVVPLDRVADAHRRMQASEHFGKIVLRVS